MASAGVLWVSVKPSLEGFGADLRRQIEESIPPEIRIRVRPDGDPAAQGAQQAGAFADAYKARLRAALADIPRVNIDADASPADIKLAELRARIEAMHGLRIGVDIEAGEASARLAELESELNRLARQTPDVRVRVDAASAAAELAAFRAEVDKLDGKKVDVKVDTSSGVSGMSALITAGLALGPALIPIGAAATAALLSIGPAALAGVGAIAAVGLAFKGITSTVTAYDAAQTAAGQNSGQAAQQQQAAASRIQAAQDGVANAQRGVTQAEAAAADGAISAAEKVKSAQDAIVTAHQNAASSVDSALNSQINAEQSLASAQQAEQTAQENLTRAREQAAASLEALSFSVQDNALAQRGASLSLESAQQSLAKLGPGASQLQRDQAVLGVDQARQRIVELRAQGEDLVHQKAAADKAGINGSQQVVTAQNALTAAVQRTQAAHRAVEQAADAVSKAQVAGAQSVAKAEQALADARRAQSRQAETSANSVVSAKQSVVAAERSLDQAQQASATSSGAAATATAKYQAALAQLSPAGQDFVKFYISDMKPRLDDLAKVAQSGLLPGLQAGIVSAAPAFGQMKTFIGNISSALGDLARDAGKALTQPFWHDFFDFMSRIAGPTIRDLGTIFGNWVQGLAGIFQKLYQPVFVPILNWFKDLSERVKNFSTSPAFQTFLDYVKENGPKVRDLFGAIWTIVKNLIEGLSGQGSSALTVLTSVLKWIAALPPGVLAALYDVFVAVRLMKIADGLLGGLDGVLARIGLSEAGGIRGGLAGIRGMGGLAGVLGIGAALYGLNLLGGKLHELAGDTPVLNPDGTPALNPDGSPKYSTAKNQTTAQGFGHAGASAADQVTSGSEGTTALGAIGRGDLGFHETFDFANSPVAHLFSDIGKRWNEDLANIGKSPAGHLWATISSWWTGFSATVNKWLDDNINRPVHDFFTGLGPNISKWWNDDVWNPTRDFFTSLPATIRKWWNDNVWNPTRDFFTGLPGTTSKWWNDNVWNPTRDFFTGLPGTIRKWWNDNVWNPTRDFFTGLPPTITKWWNDNVWNPTRDFFTGLPGTISSWWTTSIWNPTRDFFVGLGRSIATWWADHVVKPFRDGIGGVLDLMGGFASAIDSIASTLGFTINLRANLDGMRKAIGLATGGEIDVIHRAAGGTVSGQLPGYSPGHDTIPAMAGNQPYMLAGGEYIVRPEATKALGPAAMAAINNAHRTPVDMRYFNAGGPIGLAAGGFTPPAPGTSGGQTWGTLDRLRQQMFPGSVLTSAYRPGDPGYHGKGEAIDIGWAGNDQAHLMPIAAALVAKYGGNSAEIIHNPNGSVKDGRNVPASFWGPQTWAEHANHVHWAMTPAGLATAPGGAIGNPGNLVDNVLSALAAGAHAVLDPAKRAIDAAGPKFGFPGRMAAAGLDKVFDSLFGTAAAKDAAANAGSFSGTNGPAPPGQINNWIQSALGLLGYPGYYAAGLYHQIMTESGGNPRAVQHGYTDVNTLSGNLAQGIMQVIPPTFRANMLPGHGDPFNPVDNIAAGSHYAMNKYGAGWFADGPWHGHGYDSGGWLMPGMTAARNATKHPEAVLTAPQWADVKQLALTGANRGSAGDSHLHLHEVGFDQVSAFAEFQRRQDFARRTA